MTSDSHDPKKPDNEQSQQSDTPDFFGQLQEMGKQFEQTVRGMVESERTQNMQREMSESMHSFLTQMQNTAKQFQENPQVQQWVERGQQTVEQAQQQQVVKDFQQTVARGMGYMNQQLKEFSARMPSGNQTADGEPTPGADATKDANEQPQEAQAATADFISSLQALGKQFEQSMREVMTSERTQNMQREMGETMQAFFGQLQNAAKTVQEDPRVQNATEKGRETVGQVQQSQAAKDLQETLARGIDYFNQQLNEFNSRLHQGTPQTDAPASQDIPIDDESGPATGPTTRLDPDSGPPKDS